MEDPLQKLQVLLRGRCRPSEVVYTPFWDSVGYGLPEFAGRLLNFNAVVNRNVEDASITLPDKKRDYMVHLLKRLLIGVYAMELGSDAPLTPIIDEFEIASSLGRRKVINLFINLTRWVHTVHAMGLLPPPPPAPLAIPFSRPSPYPDMGEVELTLHFKHVTKSFAVPIAHLHELLDVYTTLAELGMPDVIRCRSFKIGGREKRPLLNFLLVTPKGAVFHSALDTSGEEKSAVFIAKQLSDIIDEIGPEQFVQVVTDSAASCKAAGALIEARYPSITWSPCAAHCLDLALADIGKLPWVQQRITQCSKLVKFILNHHGTLAIFRQHAELELLRPGDTRFATSFIMMSRLLELRGALEKTVVSDAWRVWCAKNGRHQVIIDKVRKWVRKRAWWEKVEQLVDLSRPIVKLLRLADSNAAVMGKMYYNCSQIQRHIEQLPGLGEDECRALLRAQLEHL
ncbi:hypothetical protein WJX72_001847 [[Myrmecia] bisecta]|uniref:DUF659 domain-containing protein n=1 Tax=[Myrmecia] bisecta TaxID=41462 RepID=A0AAW1PN39_9CHLO